MAALNEAYRVLRHPMRRADYDAALSAMRAPPAAPRREATVPPGRAPLVRVDDRRPARYPWKLVLVSAAVGAGAVLTFASLREPEQPARPDNVLQPGSCVAIEANEDAREVACTGAAGEQVVQQLVPLDGACPPGVSAYRDRQGMGYACVTRREVATT
jgi:hypothetical protein